MKILGLIIPLLMAVCQTGSTGISSAVARTGKRICLITWLLAAALALLLGALGLMVAALFIGLTPHLGAHWAAMVAAGASLAGSGIFMAVALRVPKGR